MTVAEKLTKVAENVPKLYDAGKDAERTAFWEQLQMGGKRTAYPYCFAYSVWTDDIYNPIYDFTATTPSYMFYLSGITDTKVNISTTASNLYGTFQGESIRVIQKLDVIETCAYPQTFQNCTALESITFGGVIGNDVNFRWSKKLNADSIHGIITHLGGTNAATLTLPSTSRATYDAKFGSGALDALIANKPSNWTITISAT